jgi:AcrR family transcriptional regulator
LRRAQSATPQQQRSRDTLERLIAAANTEFAERGVAGATTTSIAERADVSVGALYRFFADKHAFAEALSHRYLDAAGRRFSPILLSITTLADVEPAMRSLVRAAAELQADHAGYYRLSQELRPDAEQSPAHVVRASLVDGFDAVLRAAGSTAPSRQRKVVLEMAIETVRHTLVMHPPGARSRRQSIEELEEMVVRYVTGRLGLPTAK